MVLDNEIQIRVNSTALKHYREKGYVVNMGDQIIVKIDDLTKSSGYKIHVKCDICGNEKYLPYISYLDNIKKYNLYTCSNKCAYVKNKKTCLEKYGDENYHNTEKIKVTNLKKYGCENVFQNEEIKNKIKKTNLEKFGFESHNKSDIVKKNKEKIYLEKYGVTCPMNTIEQIEKSKVLKIERYGSLNNYKKIKETFLKKYNVEHNSQIKEIADKKIKKYKKTINKKFLIRYKEFGIISANFDTDIFVFNCEKGHTFEISNNLLTSRISTNTKLCTICNPIGQHISGQEILFSEYLKEIYMGEILLNTKKIINPNELDIYLPELKLAFEYNGLFWHNELHRNKTYHRDKTDQCEKKGIKLIHIYEDDWMIKTNIVKSYIFNLLGKISNKIFARKCVIKEINNKIVRDFLENNHLRGFVESQIKIGLFYENELVSLMTFVRSNKYESVYEMMIFCNKLNTTIIGGSNKIFKYFIDKYKPLEVISYDDRSWSQGELYKKLRFTFVDKTPPNYYYIIDKTIRKHRFEFSKNILVKQGYNSNLSEHEIMLDRKIYRIYDSGSLKFVWKNNI